MAEKRVVLIGQEVFSPTPTESVNAVRYSTGRFNQPSNGRGTADTLTVCHLGSPSDWGAFQEPSCADGDRSQPAEEENKHGVNKRAYGCERNEHRSKLAW